MFGVTNLKMMTLKVFYALRDDLAPILVKQYLLNSKYELCVLFLVEVRIFVS